MSLGDRHDIMSDTYTISLKNFRSIRDATVDLAPLTVIYGKNGSGKSSLLYGLLTLRNFLSNPNQNMPGLFSYPSIQLGGFNEVVHGHNNRLKADLSVKVSDPEKLSAEYTLSLGEAGGQSRISFDNPALEKGDKQGYSWQMPSEMDLDIAVPYSALQHDVNTFAVDAQLVDNRFSDDQPIIRGSLDWNGFLAVAQPDSSASKAQEVVSTLNVRANLPMDIVRQTGFAPLRRGFSRPNYGITSFSPYLVNEDEVASSLSPPDDRFRHYKVSDYFEEITACRVNIQSHIGTPIFSIDVTHKNRGIPNSIVNEGFGLNQLLYLLTICLNPNYKIVAIEEPEIHLHPSMIRKLAVTLAAIARQEDRCLLVSTHSETFVVALLTQMASGKLPVDDVSFLLTDKRNGETTFEKCEANDKGQISGGLKPFMAEEMEDVAVFLGN